MPEHRWALLSGEYPPRQGGVADYTAQLAAALAAAGDEVHVWAPAPMQPQANVILHALPDAYGRRSRAQLHAELAALRPPPQLLIQYVPHAYGRKAMNIGFSAWVARQRHLRPWIMFHEVAVLAPIGEPLRRRALAAVTQHMARQLQRAAAHSYVSTPRWGGWLEALAPRSAPCEWLPVPSNLPTETDPAAILRLRSEWPAATIIGSFGRFDNFARAHLRPLLTSLLQADRTRLALLVGRGSERLGAEIAADAPCLRPQVRATGALPAETAATHLAATDLLIQVYGDGISGRRGTAMAGLALGRCLLTHEGASSEPLWRESGAVALAPLQELYPRAEELLADTVLRRQLGDRARRLYHERFALECTVHRLRTARA